MAKNYDSPGEILEFAAPAGGVISGNGYLIGSALGIAQNTVAAAVRTTFFVGPGVVVVNKVSAQAWTEGLKIYWVNTAFNFTSTVGTNTLVGYAAAAAANPSATGKVRLDGATR